MKYLLTIFLSLFIFCTLAEDKIVEIVNIKKLKKIEKKIKFFYKTNKNWRKNKNNPDIGITSSTKFEPNEFKFVLDKPINGIKVSGTIIPIAIGDILNTNWGKSLVKFTRVSDEKTFSIYIDKLVFSRSNSICKGYEKEDFDYEDCQLNITEPFVMNNIVKDRSLYEEQIFSLKDIDFDGIDELLVKKLFTSRAGSTTVAYNIINNQNEFDLKKNEEISVVYTTTKAEFQNPMLIVRDYGSCCSWIEHHWKADKGNYNLVKIKEVN